MIKYKTFLILSLLAIATFIYTSNLVKPFLHHNESSLSEFGFAARNFLTHGYAEIGFAPLNLSGPIEYYNYKKYYRTDHPFLRTYILSIVYRIFGVSEASTRGVFIIFAIGCIVLFYMMAKILLDENGALIAAFFFSFNPMFAYMSQASTQQAGTLFFILLSMYFYLLWRGKRVTRYLIWTFISAFFACNMDWPGYWIAVVLFVYHFSMEKESRKTAFTFIIANLIFFGLYLFHLYLLDTKNLYPLKWLFFAGASRSLSELPGIFAYLKVESREIALYFTLAILVLSLIWLIKFIKGPRTKNDWFIFATIFLGLDEVVFPNLAYNHDYYSYYLVVFFSLSAGAGFYVLYNIDTHAFTGVVLSGSQALPVLQSRNGSHPHLYRWGIPAILNKAAKLIAIALVCVFVIQSAIVLHNRYTKTGAYELYYKMALEINKHTDYRNKILIVIDNLQYYTPFYADRYYTTYDANRAELLETNISPRIPMKLDDFKNFLKKNAKGFDYAIATTKELVRRKVGFLKDADDDTLKRFNIEDEKGELYKFLSDNYHREIYDCFTFFKLK